MCPAEGHPGARPDQNHPRASNFRHWLLLLAIGGAFVAQARTLTFFFFQDDYVPFGEIVTNGARTYLWNLITLQDLTPNWRVMPGTSSSVL